MRRFARGRSHARQARPDAPNTRPARRSSANPLWSRLATRPVGGAGVYGSPTQSSASNSPNCLKSTATAKSEDLSSRLDTSQVTPPCLSCTNSDANACPKLADRSYVPTGPVQFSWQVKFLTFTREGGSSRSGPGKFSHVIQKIEKNVDFSQPPAGDYPYTPLYWEAFDVTGDGQSDIDYWQFELPDGASGNWSMAGTLYLVEQLPDGMAVGNVTDAGNLPSTTTEPDRLGRVLGTRRIGAKFDFTGPYKKHHQ